MKLTSTQVVELLETLTPETAHTIASLAVALVTATNPLALWAKARGDEEPPQGLADLHPGEKGERIQPPGMRLVNELRAKGHLK
ncbi:MAG TPA: hypothetical protein H9867_01660 [Candidatus Corynebacterium gallistercoris]|uniref:Uncharacterized protein n=1 Tax=Candidatus Corynebacterium gallistercoris TaxID=2838530 RepID=A0A9D1RWW0_9CORY|nr:hypothetical protein [Candidatus Corynebacterium gallistercoris]